MGVICNAVGRMERRIATSRYGFALYAAPYRRLVRRELRLLALVPGTRLLNVGCGSVPFSAILCAQMARVQVVAIDRDPEAVTHARELIIRLGLQDQLTVIRADAAADDLPTADAALIALQAKPKDAIRRNVARSLVKGVQAGHADGDGADGVGGRMVFRLPRRSLEAEYGRFEERNTPCRSVRHLMPTFDRSELHLAGTTATEQANHSRRTDHSQTHHSHARRSQARRSQAAGSRAGFTPSSGLNADAYVGSAKRNRSGHAPALRAYTPTRHVGRSLMGYFRFERTRLPRLVCRGVGALEHLAAAIPWMGALYARTAYATLIDRERSAARVRPGDHVLMVGGGPFPATAIALAAGGCYVTVLERDRAAARRARKVVRRRSVRGVVRIICRDALRFPCVGFAAVIVALHVVPKAAVLRHIVAAAEPGTRILYRNPRGELSRVYERLTPANLGILDPGRSRKLPAGKELVMVTKDGARSLNPARPGSRHSGNPEVPAHADGAGRKASPPSEPCPRAGEGGLACALCDLAPKQRGTIADAPDLPQLAALGFRPGKPCTVVAAQPWGGPIVCSVGERQVALQRSVAAAIRVTPAES